VDDSTTNDNKGIDSKKCANLLLDGVWTQWGIPTTITSDQGPLFVGQWFQTMCGRLGIREAFSKTYQPQVNSRAAVAGQQLIGLFRKLYDDEEINSSPLSPAIPE
jgi:hypothetical protein